MSSKRKKASKSSTRSFPSPNLLETAFQDPESATTNGEFNMRVLSNAAVRFPHLISEKPSCALISDIETSFSNDNRACIWLSQEFMVSASLRPQSLVSVALAASDKQPLSLLPLYSFEECNTKYPGINSCGNFSNEVGCYFAIATVLLSSKVQNNGARLSWSLSCTMCFPVIGQLLFLSSVGYFSSCLNESSINSSCQLYLHKCKNLNLNLLPFASHGTTSLRLKNSHASSLEIHSPDFLDVTLLNLVLTDERSKDLYKKFVSSWLCGRYLLDGNLVTSPVFGKILISSVENPDELMTSCSSQTLISEVKNNSLLSKDDNTASLDTKHSVLYVEAKTQISFSIPTFISNENSSLREFPVDGCFSEHELDDISRLGGLSKEFTALEKIIKSSFEHSDPSLRTPMVLLYGPPCTGKTTLALCCVRSAGVRFFVVNGLEIVDEDYCETMRALHKVFDSAKKAAPAVVFIDDLDAAFSLSCISGGKELFMATTLLNLIDDIKKSYGVLIIAATNRPEDIYPALKRRFDKNIEIGVPSPVQRLDILQTLLKRMDHSLSNSAVESLAFVTHGFVGCDLAALCYEAAKTALRRFVSFESFESPLMGSNPITIAVDKNKQGSNIQGGEVPFNDDLDSLSSPLSKLTVSPRSIWSDSTPYFPESNCSYVSRGDGQRFLLKITAEDFEVAKKKIRPCSMHEIMLEIPNVRWEDIGGQKELKRQLIEMIQWPLVHPEVFEYIGVRPPPRGLLMVGPPGCSKTMMAKAVAFESKLNFLAVKGPELFIKWVGDSEKAVKSIFAKGRLNAPAIIFFDEIDGLAGTPGIEDDNNSVGDRVLKQLLVEMDGLKHGAGVIVIAATNRPDKIDPALLRSERFDRILDVQPPNESDREEIFRIYTRNVPCSPDVSLKELARLTAGYTGADIKSVCHEAACAAVEESLEVSEVSMEHFRAGVRKVSPTSKVLFYQKLTGKFRRCADYRSESCSEGSMVDPSAPRLFGGVIRLVNSFLGEFHRPLLLHFITVGVLIAVQISLHRAFFSHL